MLPEWMNALWLRITTLLRRRQLDRDLNDELQFRLAAREQKLMEQGVPPEEAHYAARREFGSATNAKEANREMRTFPFLETLWQDIRYGVRQLRRNPGFTAVAVITLALGIGANTAIFSVVEGVLLSPLPYFQPDRLVEVYESNPHTNEMPASYLNFKDWQRDNHSFQGMAAYRWDSLTLTSPGPSEEVDACNVSAGFFSVLGVKLSQGRGFVRGEDQQGGAPVVILSERLWRRSFTTSSAALGKVVTLDGKDYSVIGVLPRGFRLQGHADVYIPLGQGNPLQLDNRSINPGIHVVARLKPSITVSQGSADMRNVQQRLDELYPKADGALGSRVVPLKQAIVGDVGRTLFMLFGAVGLVLLIACANVASLLLARATARSRELTLRAALGAGRARLIRLLLTESVLLAIMGGALGLLVAHWGLHPILAAVPGSVPRSHNISLNFPVLFFTFGVSVLAGIFFGLAPAFRSSRTTLQRSLQEGSWTSASGRRRSQQALVIFQIGVTLVLLAAAGLTIQTVLHVWEVNPGFNARHVLTFEVALSPSITRTPSDVRSAYRQLLGRLKNIRGVSSAGLTTLVPMRKDSEIAFWTGSEAPPSFQKAPWALLYAATPGYLATMQIPLRRGRFFTAADRSKSAPVAVIDDTFSRHYFPGQNPVGRELNLEFLGHLQIVGVVGHVKHWGLTVDARAPISGQIYIPFYQIPDRWMKTETSGNIVVLRTSTALQNILPEVRRAVYGVRRDQPVYDVETMEQIISATMSYWRFPMLLLAVFAAVALVLSMVGIYGVTSYFVIQRTHEFGIRMALGAKQSNVLGLVLGQGFRLALTGLLIGVIGALGLMRFFASSLYGVKATDPFTLVAVSLILMGVTLLDCYIPARRATKVDPMEALRYG